MQKVEKGEAKTFVHRTKEWVGIAGSEGTTLLWGVLDLRHVFWSKKVLVFGAMEDITNDEY